MSRRSRKQLVQVDENYEQFLRDEWCRQLQRQLHREWQEQAFQWHHNGGRSLPIGVVESTFYLVDDLSPST